jgi:hypothetical protein
VAFREVQVNEVREVLRCWLSVDWLRMAAERAGVEPKTARATWAAQAGGLLRDGGEVQLFDELMVAVVAVIAVIAVVRPARQRERPRRGSRCSGTRRRSVTEAHFNTRRPHRPLEQRSPIGLAASRPSRTTGAVLRMQILGGLINECQQAA